MRDMLAFHRRRRKLFWWAQALFWGGLAFMVLDLTTVWPTTEKGAFLGPTLVVIAVGAALYLASRKLPLAEVLDLARERRGRLTLSEITSELQIDLRTAELCIEVLRRKKLVRSGMAIQQDVLIFPDSYALPEAEALAVAQKHGGTLTVALVREELRLDQAAAEETLRSLEMQGYLKAGEDDGTPAWRLTEAISVKMAKGAPLPMPGGSPVAERPVQREKESE